MRKKSSNIGKTILNAAIVGLSSVIAVMMVSGLRLVVVSGESMSPTLSDHQPLLASTKISSVNVGDIVVFKVGTEITIKRVVAMDGSHVLINSDGLFVDGVRVGTIMVPNYGDSNTETEFLLGEDELFVVGDNSLISFDSRDYGPIKESNLIAKVIFP